MWSHNVAVCEEPFDSFLKRMVNSPMSLYKGIALCILFLLLLQGASADRSLGLAVGPSTQDYQASLRDAVEAGSQVFEIPQQWKQSKQTRNTQLLSLLNSLLPSLGLRAVLTLNPLDTLENQIPTDLRHKSYDDPEFVNRYRQFVDRTLAALPECQLVSISVGNEVDILLGQDSDRWRQYTVFFKKARAHIKKRRPDVPVGGILSLPRNSFTLPVASVFFSGVPGGCPQNPNRVQNPLID